VNEIDYILVYAKSSSGELLGLPFTGEDEKIYDQEDQGGKYLTRTLRKTGGEDRREDRPRCITELKRLMARWFFLLVRLDMKAGGDAERIHIRNFFCKTELSGKMALMDGSHIKSFYLEGRLKQPSNLWQGIEGNKKASLTIKELFDGKVFDTPKPVGLVEHCLKIATKGSDLVLDFFAGSSTTAHGVIALNSHDGGSRRFIMVQLAEACSETSEALKMGYKTIAEISKERIRLAGNKILEGQCDNGWNKDIGFRVLKIDTSNVADVYYAPDVLDKGQIDLLVDNIKPDRTAEDLLFQVMLDWGVDLSLPIAKQTIQGKDVFLVDGNALAACFDASGGIDEPFVKALAKLEPLRVVFRDAGFKDSAVKINIEQIFKLLSPATEVKSI